MSAAAEGADPPFRSIVVVGVGLIGGSVGLAARARWPGVAVTGIDRRDALRDALSFGAITRTASDVSEAAAGADVVVLAAPVAKNAALLAEIAAHVSPATVVTDVGSTKRAIVAAARAHAGLTFVGGHPLAGASVSGVHAAREQLFRGRPWILTPDAGTDQSAVDRVRRFVLGLGALPEVLDADRHDRLVAFVSHLPQLVASGLLHTVGEAVGQDGLALSGPGLADTTRLASSPPGIWTEIFQSNADYVEAAVSDLTALLGGLKTTLRSPEQVTSVFTSAARWRAALRRVGEGSTDRTMAAVRTYLEMTERPEETRPFPDGSCRVERMTACPPSFYRYLYAEVGRPWHWLERLPWTDAMIDAHLGQRGLELLAFYCDGAPAGFTELKRDPDGSVEICYFGLLPQFLGRRLGGAFLVAVLAEAWRPGTRRVWLHTCTLDHPGALSNYVKRGFVQTRSEPYIARLAPERLSENR